MKGEDALRGCVGAKNMKLMFVLVVLSNTLTYPVKASV